MSGWTYGAELELSDWPRGRMVLLPVAGMGIDLRDVTMVNSDGVAVDPRGELYHLGGEIQTCPSTTPDGVADQLTTILHHWPMTTVNYRSNLHVHVRMPGLREDLVLLKRIQAYAHRWLPEVLPIIEPIPVPQIAGFTDQAAYMGAMRRYRRRRVSHQTLLSAERLGWQMEATTIQEFREAEVRHPETRALHWAIHPRLCLNLRQLWETDTIEFRHFPGTVLPWKLASAVNWCSAFLAHAMCDEPPLLLARNYEQGRMLPTFEPYDHYLETGYRLTSRKYHDAETVRTNIALWLARRGS